MIHGIYVKSKPKGKWYLVSVAISAEVANNDVIVALNKAKQEGNDLAEASVHTFQSGFYIPESLIEVNSKTMYN